MRRILKNIHNYFKTLKGLFSFSIFIYLNIFVIASLFVLRLLRDNVENSAWWVIFVIFTLVCLALFLILLRPIKGLVSKSCGVFDIVIISLLNSLIICFALSFPCLKLLSKEYYLLTNTLFVLICLLMLAFLIRIIVVSSFKKSNKVSLLSLKDIAEDVASLPEDKNKCLLKDEAVDYDLLGREFIINRIESAIESCTNGGTIALTGKWGAGKTTLLNVSIKKYVDKGYIYCNDIDAWGYKDEKLLFVAILKSIYSSLKIGKDDTYINSSFEKLASSFLSATKASFLEKLLDFDFYNKDSSLTIINDYLEKNNKHVIFALDNIDRATNEIMLFVYKIIANILKLKNVVFICLFDEERARKALEKEELKYDYLEKVFLVTINIPNPTRSSIYNIAHKCLDNYFAKYFNDEYLEFNETDKKIIRTIINSCDNLRMFILLFNSLSNILSLNYGKTNIVDTLAVELLKFRHDGIYDLVKANPSLFVCCHKSIVIKDYYFTVTSEKLNKERKEFVQKYFEKNQQYYPYAELIDLLFPNYISYGSRDVPEDLKVRAEKGKRIYSGKYFSSYFDEKETAHGQLSDDLKQVLFNSDAKTFYKGLDKIFDSYSIDDHSEILKQIYDMLSLKEINYNNLFWYMLSRYYWFDSNPSHIITSKRYSVLIICKLITEKKYTNIDSFEKEYNNDFGSIVLLYKIYSHLVRFDENHDDKKYVGSIADRIKRMIVNLIGGGVFNGIDFYSSDYYDLGITGVLKENNEITLKKIITDYRLGGESFLALLNDFVEVSTDGKKVFYSMNLDYLINIFGKPDLFDKVHKINGLREEDKTIKKLCEATLNNGGEQKEPFTLELELESLPTFHYDFYRRSSDNRYMNKPEDF